MNWNFATIDVNIDRFSVGVKLCVVFNDTWNYLCVDFCII